MAENHPPRPSRSPKQKTARKKLPQLPQNAKVTKRPLLRPAIPSPHAGASQQKIVYVSTKTPFMSAVKRVEKLLHLADKRAVQSATTTAKQQGAQRGGKRKRGADGDEILGIAEEMERMKRDKRRKGGDATNRNGGEDGAGEGVVLKGTGKAIHRVLELALWFQQREQEYVVRLKTDSVGAIDDISVEEEANPGGEDTVNQTEDAMDVDGAEAREREMTTVQGPGGEELVASKTVKNQQNGKKVLAVNELPETRIRYASVLEAAVSLR